MFYWLCSALITAGFGANWENRSWTDSKPPLKISKAKATVVFDSKHCEIISTITCTQFLLPRKLPINFGTTWSMKSMSMTSFRSYSHSLTGQMISHSAGPESICFCSWARLAYTPDVQHANIQLNSTWARIWHVYWTEPTGLCRSNWLSSVHSHWCEYMFKKCKTLCCPEQYKGKCVLIILL